MIRNKILILLLLFSIVLVGCGGDVSDEVQDELINKILNDDITGKYIIENSDFGNKLSKGDFNKDLGIIEYSIFLDVNDRFYKLTHPQKHYIAKNIFELVTKKGNLECSGNKSCRVTSVLMFYYSEEDLEIYYYNHYPEFDTFSVGSEIIHDIEIVH